MFFNIARSLSISTLLSILLLSVLPAIALSHESDSEELEPESLLIAPNEVIGNKISNHTFTDQDGKTYHFQETLGKPVVVSFIYTLCEFTCSLISSNLSLARDMASKELGKDFTTVSIGFDVENDTPSRMREHGLRFTNHFDNWKFLSADKATIEKITKEFGFFYKKEGDGFAHMNMVTIVDSSGKVYKHVYGQMFKPKDIIDPLKETLSGRSAGPASKWDNLTNPSLPVLEKIKLLCSRYNPSTGTYEIYPPYFIAMAIQFLLIFITIPIVWGRELSRLLSFTVRNIRRRGIKIRPH